MVSEAANRGNKCWWHTFRNWKPAVGRDHKRQQMTRDGLTHGMNSLGIQNEWKVVPNGEIAKRV